MSGEPEVQDQLDLLMRTQAQRSYTLKHRPSEILASKEKPSGPALPSGTIGTKRQRGSHSSRSPTFRPSHRNLFNVREKARGRDLFALNLPDPSQRRSDGDRFAPRGRNRNDTPAVKRRGVNRTFPQLARQLMGAEKNVPAFKTLSSSPPIRLNPMAGARRRRGHPTGLASSLPSLSEMGSIYENKKITFPRHRSLSPPENDSVNSRLGQSLPARRHR